MTFRRSSPRARTRWFVLLGAVTAMTVLIGTTVLAGHSEASLAGSNFEIDTDANLKVDDAAPSVDWASFAHTGTNPPEIRATDKVNGTGDNSYAGGVKEDTVCPGETTDSIPPNKSDLLSFHVYREPGSGSHPGFLNLAWSRVSDPSGTTLMDFEFNQSSTKCASGPNVLRTTGDLLIEYAIDQGGAQANITARTWTGTAWGPTSDLDANSATCPDGNGDPAPCAAGTINSSTIPAAESDGLITTGSKQARTFGEAQIDLRLIFQPNKCASFGTAMLKSRSSDSFTSQLKDFVAPVGINLTNCGKVIIRKETDPDGAAGDFGFTKSFGTDPTSGNTFTLSDGENETFNGVLFGSNYTVIENAVESGFTLVDINCSASSGVTVQIGAGTTFDGDYDSGDTTVKFSIDSDTDILDCTYTNKTRVKIIVVTCDDTTNAVINSGIRLGGVAATDVATVTAQQLTDASVTNVAEFCDELTTFGNLAPGTYRMDVQIPDVAGGIGPN